MLMPRHRATAAAAAAAITAAATTAAAATAAAAAAAATAAAAAGTAAAGLSIRRPWCSEDMDEEVSEHRVAGYLPRHSWMAVYLLWTTEVAGYLPRPAAVAGRGTAHHPQRVRAWLGLGLGL